jgi:RimJ/RimL family protein N-acetyltransferase
MPRPASEYQAEVLQTIHNLIHTRDRGPVLNCLHGQQPYSLVLLTAEHAEDKKIIELLSKWRKQHEWWFPAQFNVTEEGTAKWLRNQLIDAPDRILFMIKTDDEYLGHVGLFRFNFEEKSCEIDNIVRGEHKIPGIMGNAIVNMMKWGRKALGLRGYELQTFSDNDRSLALYRKLGFSEVKRVPLIPLKGKDRVDWVDAPESYSGSVERYNVFMVLSDHSAISG